MRNADVDNGHYIAISCLKMVQLHDRAGGVTFINLSATKIKKATIYIKFGERVDQQSKKAKLYRASLSMQVLTRI